MSIYVVTVRFQSPFTLATLLTVFIFLQPSFNLNLQSITCFAINRISNGIYLQLSKCRKACFIK